MARLTWSESAREDLRAIRRYVTRDSKPAAARLAGDIMRDVRRLGAFPESGRLVPELGEPSYREIIVGRYRVIYRYIQVQEIVEILMVVHGSRLLPSLPDEG